MEQNHCVFKTKKSRCKSDARMDLPLLICQQHLKQYYGLELGYVEIDDINHVSFAGSFLKPIKGYSIFNRNEVIIPTKEFFDANTRPGDVDETNQSFLKKFTMNKRITETIREYAQNFPESMEDRHVIEMYRNLIGPEHADPGPTLKDQLPKLQASVETSKVQSQVYIRTQPVFKTLEHNNLYIENQSINIHSSNKFSENFQYLLNNCLYSEMEIDYNEGHYLDVIPPNTIYVERVGLVATEQIADPLYLILDGHTSGSPIFYNAHVTLLPKIVQESKYTVKDIPKQYKLNEAWKGGSLC